MIMKNILFILLGSLIASPIFSQKIEYKINSNTYAIEHLSIQNDERNMNWILETTGKQYQWVTEKYGWGLGYFTKEINGIPDKVNWDRPKSIDGNVAIYQAGDIEIRVKRELKNGDLFENYIFTNKNKSTVSLSDIGIYTPFNDNYPDAETCVNKRVNAHVWDDGYNASYVEALHMGGKSPHIGLALLEGAINGYDISERDINKSMSNFRGVISLVLSDMQLKPNESKRISWVVFTHHGKEDFYRQLLKRGGVYVECDKYVVEKGQKVKVFFHSEKNQDKISLLYNGVKKSCYPISEGCWGTEIILSKLGDNKLEFRYGKGKKTFAHCFVVSSENELINKRADFIISNQQMNDEKDPRYGAYMVYDCEENKLFLNDRKTVSYHDRDEGAERLGMGVFLAKKYLITKDERIKESLLKYALFIRNKLQDKDFTTWSTVDHKGRNRAYNYPWVANFYFYMYKLTKDKKFLNYGYGTLQAMFKYFGYGFYAIDIPVSLSLSLLKDADMLVEYNQLLSDYQRIGEVYLKNGTSYPKHEVNYEQSIVAPAVMVLSQLYLVTKDSRYLDEAKKQLSLLEAFSGSQPSYHLNEISIRHWDGYWFGKREMWGDVFPHYWSTLSAAAYHYYYMCTGDKSYQKRAENIVRNNLCLFFENGEASCAYMYPNRVNDENAKFYDPFANDQDWALVYYLLVNKNL